MVRRRRLRVLGVRTAPLDQRRGSLRRFLCLICSCSKSILRGRESSEFLDRKCSKRVGSKKERDVGDTERCSIAGRSRCTSILAGRRTICPLDQPAQWKEGICEGYEGARNGTFQVEPKS
ncbi:hypothetical protein Q1695_013479 [Nippostrongylus brasiliensis]|nr:hypothetical protein Q1695_013479 [Nippostrongylus brasiliensis]